MFVDCCFLFTVDCRCLCSCVHEYVVFIDCCLLFTVVCPCLCSCVHEYIQSVHSCLSSLSILV